MTALLLRRRCEKLSAAERVARWLDCALLNGYELTRVLVHPSDVAELPRFVTPARKEWRDVPQQFLGLPIVSMTVSCPVPERKKLHEFFGRERAASAEVA